MIILPTRKRLNRRRNACYQHLRSIIAYGSIQQVEAIMRQVHGINLKLRTYFKREGEREPIEIFSDDEEYNFTTQNTFTGEIAPTLKEISEIEEQIKRGEI